MEEESRYPWEKRLATEEGKTWARLLFRLALRYCIEGMRTNTTDLDAASASDHALYDVKKLAEERIFKDWLDYGELSGILVWEAWLDNRMMGSGSSSDDEEFASVALKRLKLKPEVRFQRLKLKQI
ncbi:hypothetical protein CC80DRAFT_509527 [Byssothecium circinans]|uniref:Uncharacterized protein n=1 Tax=Byssothecium circinans TaxID=147558 RepID=A0A6A5TEQ4_9PLEO|nr:hypothetical protein CC80DRAFT_509527 [Byssothecium circinans]